MAQIVCKDLSLGYDGNTVVSGLSFKVEKGDYLAIVGENGSGKSTLLKTILSLNKQISGEIVIGDGVRADEIGYLPQQTVIQKDFPASVWEVVISGFVSKTGLRPFYNKAEKSLALSNIEKMGLKGFEKRSYRELSGGQQQRVLLARALCATRKILFLDEPVSGLDPTATEEMYELVAKLNEDGITVVMISHDVKSVLKYANKILCLGKEIFFGDKSEYVSYEKKNAGVKSGDENERDI